MPESPMIDPRRHRQPGAGYRKLRPVALVALAAAVVWWAVSGAGPLVGAVLLIAAVLLVAGGGLRPPIAGSDAGVAAPGPAGGEAEPRPAAAPPPDAPAASPEIPAAGPRPAAEPRAPDPGEPPGPQPSAQPVNRPKTGRGQQTVLAVDDQEEMLVFVAAFLEDGGYRVVTAKSGQEALLVCRELEGGPDLLLTDIRMLDMSGPELHREISSRYPATRVLFMSGFAAHWARQQGVPDEAALIEKGFTPSQLLEKVGEALSNQ